MTFRDTSLRNPCALRWRLRWRALQAGSKEGGRAAQGQTSRQHTSRGHARARCMGGLHAIRLLETPGSIKHFVRFPPNKHHHHTTTSTSHHDNVIIAYSCGTFAHPHICIFTISAVNTKQSNGCNRQVLSTGLIFRPPVNSVRCSSITNTKIYRRGHTARGRFNGLRRIRYFILCETAAVC